MKNLLILLVVVVVAIAGWRWFRGHDAGSTDEVRPFANPVYAEVRAKITVEGRTLEQVALVETENAADCSVQMRSMTEAVTRLPAGYAGPRPVIVSSTCEDRLPPHLARLFQNKPTDASYLAAARGSAAEREIRVVYWGVSAEEADLVCKAASEMGRGRKGAVTCIRSAG